MELQHSQPGGGASVSIAEVDPPDPSEVSVAWLRARAMRGYAGRWQSNLASSATDAAPAASAVESAASISSAGRDQSIVLSAANVHRDLHDRGLCQPCAYYNRKSDGCRKENACYFCHLCDNARYQAWKRRMKKFKELQEKGKELEVEPASPAQTPEGFLLAS
eukprot:TRINITY_DN16411_c1_g4_i3.p1 TRINITY_DN16411_c1_g4~~TRINITY_DN16411_c1_g4_i3.p1  ORF type:complete len:163 (-),score=15.57 TRINITY_DN16411_c1_g4_i3:320-808(-)